MLGLGSGRGLQVAAVVAALVVGLGGGLLIARAGGPAASGDAPEAAAGASEETDGAQAPPVATPTGKPVTAETEDAARQVVEQFLDAEANADFEASFDLLASSDREELGPEARWRRQHADLPPVAEHEVLDVREVDGRVEVVTDVTLVSSLNEFTGLTPARGRATWTVAEEDDGWRVRYTDSVLEPRYPDDAPVVDTALAWASARQSCDPAPPEHERMLGIPRLGLALCGSDGRVTAGEMTDLPEGADAEVFVSAYGPDVYSWSRVVPLAGPVPMRVVLAPVGDAWQVIGIMRP
jgi:ketosteroid isomerase-like protein